MESMRETPCSLRPVCGHVCHECMREPGWKWGLCGADCVGPEEDGHDRGLGEGGQGVLGRSARAFTLEGLWQPERAGGGKHEGGETPPPPPHKPGPQRMPVLSHRGKARAVGGALAPGSSPHNAPILTGRSGVRGTHTLRRGRPALTLSRPPRGQALDISRAAQSGHRTRPSAG